VLCSLRLFNFCLKVDRLESLWPLLRVRCSSEGDTEEESLKGAASIPRRSRMLPWQRALATASMLWSRSTWTLFGLAKLRFDA
jgi:hypothetical protein